MTDNIQHIDVDSDEFIDAPKALRDAYKQLKARYTESTETVNSLRGQLTSTALTDVLRDFKNPERVKRDLLADKVDPLDKSAVEAWLGANADDYARGTGSSTPPDADNDAEAQAHARLQSGDGLRQPADMTKLEAAFAEITPDMNGEQVKEIYRKHGL